MSLLDDIGTYLEAHSIGTVGEDIWQGEMQPEPDNAVGLFETPGASPEVFDRTDYPSLQVRVRSTSYAAGRARIQTIYVLLHGLHEVDLAGQAGTPEGVTRYHLIAAKQQPFSLGQSDRERHVFACNFRVTLRNAARTPPSGQ